MLYLSCYFLLKHTCDGRCQGFSDCPFAYDNNIGRLSMVKFAIKSYFDNRRMRKFLNSDAVKNDPELNKLMEDFAKEEGWELKKEKR